MPGSLLTHAVARAAKRVPIVKRLPIMRVLLLGEVVLLARTHFERLTPRERHRLVQLLRDAKGRPSQLSGAERDELQALVAKADPKAFAAAAAGKLSPVPLPGRITRRS
jgi:hypothetical protein